MRGCSSFFPGLFPLFTDFSSDFFLWYLTYIHTGSDSHTGWDSVTMESSRVPEDEITLFGTDFKTSVEDFVLFVIICEFVPVIFMVTFPDFLEKILVNFVGIGDHHKPAIIFSVIAEVCKTLEPPKSVSGWRLISVDETKKLFFSVITLSVHIAEAIKGGCQFCR